MDEPHPSRDPRLEIPETLRKPIGLKKPPTDADFERERSRSENDSVKMAQGWAIALNFAYGVVGMTLLGWVIQRWVVPKWEPWPILVGMTVGIVGGFVLFVKEALAANRGQGGKRKK